MLSPSAGRPCDRMLTTPLTGACFLSWIEEVAGSLRWTGMNHRPPARLDGLPTSRQRQIRQERRSFRRPILKCAAGREVADGTH